MSTFTSSSDRICVRSARVFVTKLIDQLIRDYTTARREWLEAVNRLRFANDRWARRRERLPKQIGNHFASRAVFSASPLFGRLKHVVSNVEGGPHASDASTSNIRCQHSPDT